MFRGFIRDVNFGSATLIHSLGGRMVVLWPKLPSSLNLFFSPPSRERLLNILMKKIYASDGTRGPVSRGGV